MGLSGLISCNFQHIALPNKLTVFLKLDGSSNCGIIHKNRPPIMKHHIKVETERSIKAGTYSSNQNQEERSHQQFSIKKKKKRRSSCFGRGAGVNNGQIQTSEQKATRFKQHSRRSVFQKTQKETITHFQISNSSLNKKQ